MISLSNGALVRPLNIRDPDNLDLALSSDTNNAPSVSFYFQTRAATYLDQVIDLIQSNGTSPTKDWLSFQILDRSLLNFLKSLVGQYLGSCCEAVAVGVRCVYSCSDLFT